MQNDPRLFSLPRWRVTRWLTDAGHEVPDEIRKALVASLFGTLPIFAGGVLNTLAVSALVASRIPQRPFLLWCVLECGICLTRLLVLVIAQRAAAARRKTPTDLYILLGLAWAASVGYGTFISLTSGDWVVATLACLSAAAMVGGISFRNFGAPRLAGAMIVLTLGSCCLAAPFTGEPLLLITFLQIPFYLASMSAAGFRLNRMLVATMQAERDHAFRARHDSLTGLLNRAGLADAIAARRDGLTALLYLDLDGFKAINDTHGHAAGDQLLQAVAERLRSSARPQDMVARIGGDEFVVLTDVPAPAALIAFSDRIVAQISVPFPLDRARTVQVGVSIGIALAPEHGTDLAGLLSAADEALYAAKALGKSRSALAPQRAAA
ncbi:diguanylate cyclase [Methylobacterium sp. Leaf111]|uniref:GGDEF domain-containing protein n=1 Tax=unclassified Methylobacterium TaxID=2615210 RepID=UPI0006F45677|nr:MULTISPECIES: GGDEF domain-containing protein [unclassified Methylobacterium]KQO68002.1 diguanylate cyclase [Methylobacterium sp. Leaf89]KQP67532.1 diguanylate cyclase [Methylobacterium sp. Leaf111]